MLMEGSPSFFIASEREQFEYPDYALICYYFVEPGVLSYMATFAVVDKWIIPYSATYCDGPQDSAYHLKLIPKTFRCTSIQVFTAIPDFEEYVLNQQYVLASTTTTLTDLLDSYDGGWPYFCQKYQETPVVNDQVIDLESLFKSINLKVGNPVQFVEYQNDNEDIVEPEQLPNDPGWFPGQFPSTPYFHMDFYQGWSFYIPDGMQPEEFVTNLQKEKNPEAYWLYCRFVLDISTYVLIAFPAYRIAAYGKSMALQMPRYRPVIPGHLVKYVDTKLEASEIAKRSAFVNNIPMLRTLIAFVSRGAV